MTANLRTVGLYVNADQIQYSSGCSPLEAAQMAEKTRNILLAAKADFTFETVLSTERNLELLSKAKEAGYYICAVFVLTCDPSINVQRVKSRVAGGGHDVPEEKIVSRYHKSLKNLKRLVRIADETRILDNSGSLPDVICDIRKSVATITPTEHWSKEQILDLISPFSD